MLLSEYPDLLKPEDVSEILRIGRGKCYELLNSGQLHGFRIRNKIWVVPRESIERFIKEQNLRKK